MLGYPRGCLVLLPIAVANRYDYLLRSGHIVKKNCCKCATKGIIVAAVKLHLEKQADDLLGQMAAAAGMSKTDLAEIAIFNLIALWMKERKIYVESSQAISAGVDDADSAS